jgi:hypothetical protein
MSSKGLLFLMPPEALPEGAEVEVRLVSSASEGGVAADGASLYERLASVAGKATSLPPDAATQHDHYLHGTPKK